MYIPTWRSEPTQCISFGFKHGLKQYANHQNNLAEYPSLSTRTLWYCLISYGMGVNLLQIEVHFPVLTASFKRNWIIA